MRDGGLQHMVSEGGLEVLDAVVLLPPEQTVAPAVRIDDGEQVLFLGGGDEVGVILETSDQRAVFEEHNKYGNSYVEQAHLLFC